MYKALLVDDEPWSLISLKNSFNWDNYGFSVVNTTTNPIEAKKMILNDYYDVVFADIRMPEVSGLDLIKAVRSTGLDTEFIIVSGYGEFSYAQEAIREGVFDYCLKPLKPEIANDLIIKLSSHIKSKRILNDNDLLENLLKPVKSLSEMESKVHCSFSYEYFTSVAVNSHDIAIYEKDLLSTENSYLLSLVTGADKYLLIINSKEDINKDIYNKLKLHVDNNSYMGISSTAKDFQSIPRIIKEAYLALNDSFIYDSKYIFQYSTPNLKQINNILKDIDSLLDADKTSEISSIINQLPRIFTDNSLGFEEMLYVLNQLNAYLSKKYSDNRLLEEFEFTDYEDITQKFKNIYSLFDNLEDAISSILRKYSDNPKDSSANESFSKLLNYINNNYQSELFLKDLSDSFHINFTYCCELFKKVTGMTFSQYVTRMRMEKASELLKSTSLSLDEICTLCGYNDYHYFIKVFKKNFNCTPTIYKNRSSQINQDYGGVNHK